MKSLPKSPALSNHNSQTEVRRLERKLQRLEAKNKLKRARARRRRLANQVVYLAAETAQAVLDGDI